MPERHVVTHPEVARGALQCVICHLVRSGFHKTCLVIVSLKFIPFQIHLSILVSFFYTPVNYHDYFKKKMLPKMYFTSFICLYLDISSVSNYYPTVCSPPVV